MAKDGTGVAKLPKQQLTILAICRFAEPVAMTSVYPYIPEMIQSFDVPTDQVAKWAGLMAAVFSLSQCVTAIAWGRASDRFGRKPIIMIGLACTMIGSVLFGFSRSLTWAFVVRSLQGLSNGNVGIIRTAVAELVPQRELQPRAFSIMPLVWTIGSIFGPAFGGSLVNPFHRFPGPVGRWQLMQQYPFAFPNLLISLFFLTGITVGLLFLHETLEDKKDRKDYGLVLGSLLTHCCSKKKKTKRHVWHPSVDESDPFLSRTDSATSEVPSPKRNTPTKLADPKTGWKEVFSRQSNINLAVYTLLAMHSVAFDQLLPIYMHHPVQSIRSPAVHLPLKFSGGFGINSSRIGVLFMLYGIFGMVIQFTIFPPFARRFGVLNCLKGCAVTFPIVYFATPFTALLPTNSLRQGVMILLMLCKGWCAIFSFPCSTILLTNSASSLKILGTLNGVATSISAVGRAAGPALAGIAFTTGVDLGYVVLSWWFLAGVAVLGAIPVWWLVEMEGFGASGTSSASDTEDDDDDEEALSDTDLGSPESFVRKSAPALIAAGSTEESDTLLADSSALAKSTSRSSQPQQQRRESFALRRVPSPIGMGPGVHPPGSRRFSSDLGASRSGFGAGGTSYH